MFFLLRMGFWFSLVLLALPLGNGGSGERVGPLDALFAAREAISDWSGLCERKPDVCRTGRAAMETVGVRAREGSRLALEFLDDRHAPADAELTTGAIAAVETNAEVVLPEVAPVPR